MLRNLFIVFVTLFILPVYAGSFDELTKNYEKVFLYLYTNECSYCVKFNPIYEKLVKKYGKKCEFIKVDANTEYGNSLMRATNGFYVPNVVLINSSARSMGKIVPTCLLNSACINDAVEKLVN